MSDDGKPVVATDFDDSIPIIAKHKGIGLHCDQTPARLAVVRREIDSVLAEHDPAVLAAFAADARNSPEARLTAHAKAVALCEQASAERRTVDAKVRLLDASIAGVASKLWQHPTKFCSDLDDAVERAAMRPLITA